MPTITPTRLPGLRATLHRIAHSTRDAAGPHLSLLPTLIALASCVAGLTVTLGTASAFA